MQTYTYPNGETHNIYEHGLKSIKMFSGLMSRCMMPFVSDLEETGVPV